MIDVSEFTSAYPGDGSITVVFDHYDGIGLVAEVRQGHAMLRIDTDPPLQPDRLELGEQRDRLFLGGCRLEIDQQSYVPRTVDNPIGGLHISGDRVGIMVAGQSRGTVIASLKGDLIADRFDAYVFSRWRLVKDRPGQQPVVIFEHGR